MRRWLLLLFSFPGLLWAQDPPEFGSDRPGLGDSTGLVGRGVWQIELGGLLQGEAGFRQWALPQPLLRWGLTDRLELRLGADGLTQLKAPDGGPSSTGVSDVTLSAKVSVLHEADAGLELTLLPVLSIPTFDDPFSSRALEPTLEALWARSLPGGFGLAGNLNAAWLKGDDGRMLGMAAGLALDHDLAEGWNGFAEIYAEATPLEDQANAAWSLDGGVTRAVGEDAQLDLSGGVGLNEAAGDWFVGLGWVRRFR